VEIRNAISQYEEPQAPLFGFLRYRRRNVVIKYVPEECSRLVQGESLPDERRFIRSKLTPSQHAWRSILMQLPNGSRLMILFSQ
jgi:hypothetical protein